MIDRIFEIVVALPRWATIGLTILLLGLFYFRDSVATVLHDYIKTNLQTLSQAADLLLSLDPVPALLVISGIGLVAWWLL